VFKLGRRYEIILIAFVVLTLFYPMLFAGENSVDDWRMLQNQSSGELDLLALFKPGGGFYYRPLLMLTFWVDKFLWDQSLGFMHLENILLHMLNAILVYFVARAMAQRLHVEHYLFPLLSGLLFAIHPITTESVNWISGRTDLLTTSFVLLTTLAIIKSSAHKSYLWAFVGSLLFVAAVISKEVSLFFFPVAVLLFWWHGRQRRYAALASLCFSSPFLLGGLAYLYSRLLTASTRTFAATDLLRNWHYDLYDTIRVSFKVFGFYVKKLFVPVPLNFAIRDVSEVYVLVGIAAMALSVYLIQRRVVTFWPFAISFYLILPAILIALTSVAWTPIAERYIYLSSAFVVIGLVPYLLRLGQLLPLRAAVFGLLLLLASATAVTAHRNYLWLDNERLYADTKQKSPNFSAIDNELGIALMKSGELDKAREVLQAAIVAGKGEENPLIYVNLASAYQRADDYDNAERIFASYIEKNGYDNRDILANYARLMERKFVVKDQPSEKVLLDVEKLINLYRKSYALSRDSFALYRVGQLELWLGNDKAAAEAFTEVVANAPQDVYYRPAAEKLADRLHNKGSD